MAGALDYLAAFAAQEASKPAIASSASNVFSSAVSTAAAFAVCAASEAVAGASADFPDTVPARASASPTPTVLQTYDQCSR